jgi:hypothetical protein
MPPSLDGIGTAILPISICSLLGGVVSFARDIYEAGSWIVQRDKQGYTLPLGYLLQTCLFDLLCYTDQELW